MVIAGLPATYRLLKQIKPDIKNTKLYGWYGDMRDPKSLAEFKDLFYGFFLTNSGQADAYTEILSTSIFPVTFAVSSTGHHKKEVKKLYNIGFSGQVNSDIHKKRKELIKKLSSEFGVVTIDNKWYDTFDFYNKCKILISDSCVNLTYLPVLFMLSTLNTS